MFLKTFVNFSIFGYGIRRNSSLRLLLFMLCWACVIFFARIELVTTLHRAHKGIRGGKSAPFIEGSNGGFQGKGAPLHGDSGPAPQFFFLLDFRVHFWAVFRHMIFPDGFLFSIKELALLTN
jgi:hypothetical protein